MAIYFQRQLYSFLNPEHSKSKVAVVSVQHEAFLA